MERLPDEKNMKIHFLTFGCKIFSSVSGRRGSEFRMRNSLIRLNVWARHQSSTAIQNGFLTVSRVNSFLAIQQWGFKYAPIRIVHCAVFVAKNKYFVSRWWGHSMGVGIISQLVCKQKADQCVKGLRMSLILLLGSIGYWGWKNEILLPPFVCPSGSINVKFEFRFSVQSVLWCSRSDSWKNWVE